MVRLELPRNFSSAVALVNAADSINALKREGATKVKKSPMKTPSSPSDDDNPDESTSSVAELHSVSSTTIDPDVEETHIDLVRASLALADAKPKPSKPSADLADKVAILSHCTQTAVVNRTGDQTVKLSIPQVLGDHVVQLEGPAAPETINVLELCRGLELLKQQHRESKLQLTIDGRRPTQRRPVASINPKEMLFWKVIPGLQGVHICVFGYVYICYACIKNGMARRHGRFCHKCANFAMSKEEVHARNRQRKNLMTPASAILPSAGQSTLDSFVVSTSTPQVHAISPPRKLPVEVTEQVEVTDQGEQVPVTVYRMSDLDKRISDSDKKLSVKPSLSAFEPLDEKVPAKPYAANAANKAPNAAEPFDKKLPANKLPATAVAEPERIEILSSSSEDESSDSDWEGEDSGKIDRKVSSSKPTVTATVTVVDKASPTVVYLIKPPPPTPTSMCDNNNNKDLESNELPPLTRAAKRRNQLKEKNPESNEESNDNEESKDNKDKDNEEEVEEEEEEDNLQSQEVNTTKKGEKEKSEVVGDVPEVVGDVPEESNGNVPECEEEEEEEVGDESNQCPEGSKEGTAGTGTEEHEEPREEEAVDEEVDQDEELQLDKKHTGKRKREPTAQEYIPLLEKKFGSLGVIAMMHAMHHKFLRTLLLEEGIVLPPRLNWAEAIVPAPHRVEFAFQVLVMLLMSSATTDDACVKYGLPLVNHALFSLDWVIHSSVETLFSIIGSAGRYNDNIKYMKEAAESIKRDFNGKVPQSIPDLMELNGVGQKIAAIVMKTCFPNANVRSGVLACFRLVSPSHQLLL